MVSLDCIVYDAKVIEKYETETISSLSWCKLEDRIENFSQSWLNQPGWIGLIGWDNNTLI